MIEKFKIKYDDYGRAFINAKDIYDALEVKNLRFKRWWKSMVRYTGYRKFFDYIVCDNQFYVTPEMAQYFCREWNIQMAHKYGCAVEIRRGYQVADLVEATEHFAKSECLIECAGCDEGIINAINSNQQFFYKNKNVNAFNSSGHYLFNKREFQRILRLQVDENCAYEFLSEDEAIDFILSSNSPEAKDFYKWLVFKVFPNLGANHD